MVCVFPLEIRPFAECPCSGDLEASQRGRLLHPRLGSAGLEIVGVEERRLDSASDAEGPEKCSRVILRLFLFGEFGLFKKWF